MGLKLPNSVRWQFREVQNIKIIKNIINHLHSRLKIMTIIKRSKLRRKKRNNEKKLGV
jgi:hypothetical protein